MENIFNTINPADMMSHSTDVISSIAPVLTLLLGILFGFFVLSFIIDILMTILTGKKKNGVIEEKEEDDDDDDDNNDYW